MEPREEREGEGEEGSDVSLGGALCSNFPRNHSSRFRSMHGRRSSTNRLILYPCAESQRLLGPGVDGEPNHLAGLMAWSVLKKS